MKPGQKGTREWTARFGPDLLCVRPRAPGARGGVVATWRVTQRIGWRKRGLQQRVKSAGGRWDAAERVWMLDLLLRVVGGGG